MAVERCSMIAGRGLCHPATSPVSPFGQVSQVTSSIIGLEYLMPPNDSPDWWLAVIKCKDPIAEIVTWSSAGSTSLALFLAGKPCMYCMVCLHSRLSSMCVCVCCPNRRKSHLCKWQPPARRPLRGPQNLLQPSQQHVSTAVPSLR